MHGSFPAAWDIHRTGGPVLATAVHAGHQIDERLLPLMKVDAATRRREEDPMTGIWSTVGDDAFRCYVSRFQIDLNRPRESAVYKTADDAWGIEVWNEQPSDEALALAYDQWDSFYAMMAEWLEGLIAEHGRVLLLDIHSYNHRRDGPFSQAATQENNPDIDLGVTTTDRSKFGHVIDQFRDELARHEAAGRKLDVRENVRYEDGGHWPEWVFAKYGENVATVTLEYKKFYMDEWTGNAFLPVVEDLRYGLAQAVSAVRKELV